MITSMTFRCIQCGQPSRDHIPLRYAWRVWWRHLVLRLARPFLSRIDDTTPDI